MHRLRCSGIFLMFLFYFGEGRVGGESLMHVYVWEHIAFLTELIDGC